MRIIQIVGITIMICLLVIGLFFYTLYELSETKTIIKDCFDFDNNKIIGISCEDEIVPYFYGEREFYEILFVLFFVGFFCWFFDSWSESIDLGGLI